MNDIYRQGAPYDYNHINIYNSEISPSTVHSQNAALTGYFRRYLLQKAMSPFKWKVPEVWAENYLLY